MKPENTQVTGAVYNFEIEQGYMQGVIIHQPHERGRNWCATIAKDPNGPSGLSRNFHKLGKGSENGYSSENICLGDALEWGADYYTGGGSKKPHRKYTLVTELTSEKIVMTEFATAARAIKARAEFLKRLENLEMKRASLKRTKNELMQKIEQVQAEIDEIDAKSPPAVEELSAEPVVL